MSARGKRDVATLQANSLRVLDYFRTEFVELEPVIGTGRRDWTLVDEIVRSRGLVNAYGQAASKAALARAWKRVVAERRQASAWETKVLFVRSRDPPRDFGKIGSRAVTSTAQGEDTSADPFEAIERRRAARTFDG